MNIIRTLGDYVNEVLDKDKDGTVSFKEFMGIFPNSAIAIALLVVDLLVLVAEYRVWDFAMHLTGDPFKAAGFVLVSGFPFYLAQVLWLYPRATFLQQMIALAMGAASLYTSASWGFADLSLQYSPAVIYEYLVWLSVFYVVSLLVYVVTDKGVKAWRMKVQAHANAEAQKEMNAITRAVLADLRESMEEEEKLKRDFDPTAVQAQLDRLRGRKEQKKQQPQQQPAFRPVVSNATDTDRSDLARQTGKEQNPQNRQNHS